MNGWGQQPAPPPRRRRRLLLSLAVLVGLWVGMWGDQSGVVAATLVHNLRTAKPSTVGGQADMVPPARPPARPHRLTTTTSHGCQPARDLRDPHTDPRIRELLKHVLQRWSVRVSCVKTGHSRYVKGTRRTSNHYHWRALDIDMVSGHPVSSRNPAAKALADWLNALQGELQPSEIGSPFSLPGGAHSFTDEDHQGHLHVGYSAR